MPYCNDCQGWPCKCAEAMAEEIEEIDDDLSDLSDEELAELEEEADRLDGLTDEELDDEEAPLLDDDDDDEELADDYDEELAGGDDEELAAAPVAKPRGAPPRSAQHCHAMGEEGGACDVPGVIYWQPIGSLCGRHAQMMRHELALVLWDGRVVLLAGFEERAAELEADADADTPSVIDSEPAPLQ